MLIGVDERLEEIEDLDCVHTDDVDCICIIDVPGSAMLA